MGTREEEEEEKEKEKEEKRSQREEKGESRQSLVFLFHTFLMDSEKIVAGLVLLFLPPPPPTSSILLPFPVFPVALWILYYSYNFFSESRNRRKACIFFTLISASFFSFSFLFLFLFAVERGKKEGKREKEGKKEKEKGAESKNSWKRGKNGLKTVTFYRISISKRWILSETLQVELVLNRL